MTNFDLLSIEKLKIALTPSGEELVRDLDLSISQAECVALIGASGSGKSLTALSVMNLLSSEFQVSGRISWCGQNLIDSPAEDWRRLCGAQISIIFQEPMTSLNPVMRVVDQVAEVLVIHKNASWDEARDKAKAALEEVGVDLGERLMDTYPHELSGGQRQRVMIAMATIAQPKLLIADEPTTALDVTVQSQILQLLKNLQKKYGMSILFITHDLNLVKKWVDRIYVMSEGKVIEHGRVEQILNDPQHAKTHEILKPTAVAQKAVLSSHQTLLSIQNISLAYDVESSFFKRKMTQLQALKNVSVDVAAGTTLGLVGESGCGKSSLAKVILGLIPSDSGDVLYQGQSINQMSSAQKKQWRQETQIVFQDPKSSLNSAHTIEQLLTEPLVVHRPHISTEERRQRAAQSLERVGLSADGLKRHPSQFSGGQRQRVAIARALMLDPKLVVFDEAVSALDSMTRAQIIDLLLKLQADLKLTYLFISHDLSVVKSLAHHIAVMKAGSIVEAGAAQDLLLEPREVYTKTLLSATEL